MNNFTLAFTLSDPFLSAGSGLVLHGDTFYIASDDELGIFSFKKDFSQKGEFHRIFPGQLTEDEKERKKLKPDFESILILEDELLILPSGSRHNRSQGALLNLKDFSVNELSLNHIFQELTRIFPELNIEGAVILQDKIRLFQRGNGSLHQNALIDLNLKAFLRNEIKDLKIKDIQLGKLSNIPLSFTDATLFFDEILFLAVAENSESTYLDGEFVGSILGRMNLEGEILQTINLPLSSKPEGIALDKENLYLVTDDDNRGKPSKIYSASVKILANPDN